MQVFNYHRITGEFLSAEEADPSPMEPGVWLIPAYATTERPPFIPNGCVALFNGGGRAVGEWRIELSPSGADTSEPTIFN
jgi:hypothetical protein